MANQLTRLLRRRPELDAAEFELLQSRVVARLKRRGPEGGEAASDEAALTAEASEGVAQRDAADTGENEEAIDLIESNGRFVAIRSTAYELPENAVGVMADLPAAPGDRAMVLADDALALEPVSIIALEAPGAKPTPGPKKRRRVQSGASNGSTGGKATVGGASSKASAVKTDPKSDKNKSAAHVATRKRAAPPVAVAPYCPYCALLLNPAPSVSRRCPRCGEGIVVKRMDGRLLYLTEASVAVFDAERRRRANSGRWTRERRRWLKAAAAAGAPASGIASLDHAPISEEAVAAARGLYVAIVERAVRSAKRERRWEDASQILRDHALVLFRMAGYPIPPPEGIVQPHREGAAAALRGIADLARAVELVSGRCCDVCRADDGRIFRIAKELRTPRLPHRGCPKGLCRCDWYLAVSDQSLVLWHMRRRARAKASLSRRSVGEAGHTPA